MSLGQSLNIALNSLKNNQYAMTVVSHNIANLNTEGYTRKAVHFEESVIGNYGTDVYSRIKSLNGATIDRIIDYMDEAALGNIIDTTSDASYYGSLADALGGLEDIADALGDNGLNSMLNDFFAAAANLEQFPDDLTIRQQYVNVAQNVCDKFNEISNNYDKYQNNMISDTQDNVEIVNNLLSRIADSNKSYLNNGQDSSILNNTYSLISELGNYVNVTTEKNANGTIDVYIGDQKVVQSTKVNYTLNVAADTSGQSDNILSFSLVSTDDPNYVLSNGINDIIKTGKIGAAAEFLNGTNDDYYNITDLKNALNNAAKEFVTELNKIQMYDDGTQFAAYITTVDGVNMLENASAIPMFVSTDGGEFNASNITVNQAIKDNVFLVAAARVDLSKYEEGSDEWKYAVGNSTNATEISALRDKKICDYGGEEDNCTLSDFLASIAAKAGLDANGMSNKADVYQDMLDNAITNYSNIAGVNIDEEIADMLKYQRAYEASARVFAAVNDLYDIIFGMV